MKLDAFNSILGHAIQMFEFHQPFIQALHGSMPKMIQEIMMSNTMHNVFNNKIMELGCLILETIALFRLGWLYFGFTAVDFLICAKKKDIRNHLWTPRILIF